MQKSRADCRSLMPILCSDDEVLAFCPVEALNISIYSQPEGVLLGRELFQAARDPFGDLRCDDLLFWIH
jgi:hypothetical protein